MGLLRCRSRQSGASRSSSSHKIAGRKDRPGEGWSPDAAGNVKTAGSRFSRRDLEHQRAQKLQMPAMHTVKKAQSDAALARPESGLSGLSKICKVDQHPFCFKPEKTRQIVLQPDHGDQPALAADNNRHAVQSDNPETVRQNHPPPPAAAGHRSGAGHPPPAGISECRKIAEGAVDRQQDAAFGQQLQKMLVVRASIAHRK